MPRPIASTTETLHPHSTSHFGVLDGWRALSILFVLAGHMLPLGLKPWQLNETVAAAGMALFFTLSGFLITTSLIRNPDVVAFLIKRVTRIVPLAWLYVAVFLIGAGAALPVIAANLLFHANSSESFLTYGPHLWSLSIEMQFYLGVAGLVLLGGRRGLWLLPALALAVTAGRIWAGMSFSILTQFRIDEILAGACLALWFGHLPENRERRRDVTLLVAIGLAVLLISTYAPVREHAPALSYARPYIAATIVGLTLIGRGWLTDWLRNGVLRYIATISYALYVIHPTTMLGWLGSGDTAERYAKRIISFALTFAGAHLSTHYFERPITDWGHRLAKRRDAKGGGPSLQPPTSDPAPNSRAEPDTGAPATRPADRHAALPPS